jgi:arginase family enzyme
MDSCRDCEGTSAAQVIGFSADELCVFASMAGANPRVFFLEIAEVAPALDISDRASRIASEIIFAFMVARARFLMRLKPAD